MGPIEIDLPGRDARRRRMPRLRILAVVVGLAAATIAYRLVSLWLEAERREAEARASIVEVAADERRTATASPDAGQRTGDDLTVIEGIGPRFDVVLKVAGITTLRDLAGMSPGRLEAILRESGGRMADPATWPHQAALAADGEWMQLAEFQASLKGGRRSR